MQITLKQLTLTNFKGIKNLTIDFEKDTSISGANATGKTTIFDAYSWLLWDKDSLNRKDFGIKPYGTDGENLHGVESSVNGILEVDGKDLELTKIYKEIWTKKRGQLQETFTGHTTDYFINSVPVKKGEYNEKIEMLIPEKEFNLLSNPMYFNQILDKKEKRSILLSLIKGVEKSEIIGKNKDLNKLDLDNYSIDEIKAMAKASAKKINDEIDSLPIRIDELISSKNDYDFKALEDNKRVIEKRVEELDGVLQGSSQVLDSIKEKNLEIQKYMDKMNEIKREIDLKNFDLESKANSEYFKKKSEFENKKLEAQKKIDNLLREKSSLDNEILLIKKDIHSLENETDRLRNNWIETNSKEFDGSLNCPACGRPFEEHDKQEILENFNIEKSRELTKIVNFANSAKDAIRTKKEDLEEKENRLEDIKLFIGNFKKELENLGEFKEEKEEIVKLELPEEYFELEKRIEDTRASIATLTNADNTAVKEEKRGLQAELNDLVSKIGLKDQNKFIDEKIEMYKEQEKELAKMYEKQQEILFLCDEYIRIYTDLVQYQINGLFENISFRLFEKQVNGEIKETVEATVNGVPYSDVNNAGKVNAGLDVINTLSKHLEISVPVFVDNAESVNELISIDGQLVKLIVSKDKNLIIE